MVYSNPYPEKNILSGLCCVPLQTALLFSSLEAKRGLPAVGKAEDILGAMSIAMESGAEIGRSGFVRRIACFTNFDLVEIEERKQMDPSPSPPREATATLSTSSSSSIGKDSDEVGTHDWDDGGEEEVQSAYKGSLLGMESLEESLPIRRSISNFYSGKSKSFTSLSDVAASCAFAKDFAKEENAYTRKRRNLLALKTMLERPLKSSGGTKKPTAQTRSTLAIAAAMSGSSRPINGGENATDQPQNFLPPLPRPAKSTTTIASTVVFSPAQQLSFSSRSFSLGDLSEMANLGSTIEPGNIEKSFK